MKSDKTLDYIPGLDGIRALACFLVISTHWPNNLLSLKFGWIGVNIFFVLSGFLITRILLKEKEKPFKEYIGHFYYKRSLRIFPLYYAFLAISFGLILLFTCLNPDLLKIETWKDAYYATTHDFPYYLSYTYNLKINLRYFMGWPDTSNHFFGHLWSLAVEEQFYFVFPFIVFFCSRKVLKIVIIGLIICCPLIRLWTAVYGVHMVSDAYWLGELLYSNTLCQSDALATGAALAVFNFKISRPYLVFISMSVIWLIAGITCFYFLRKSGFHLVESKSLGYNFPGYWFEQQTPYLLINIRAFYQYTLVNLLAVALILPAINGNLLFPSLFNNTFISYLGKISYGIYVFHNPLLALMVMLGDHFGGWHTLTANPIMETGCFILYVSILVGLAHISFKYFEKKILSLKNESYSGKK